jgi:hypothetical protein
MHKLSQNVPGSIEPSHYLVFHPALNHRDVRLVVLLQNAPTFSILPSVLLAVQYLTHETHLPVQLWHEDESMTFERAAKESRNMSAATKERRDKIA